jgi:hypothetical protein
VAPPPLAPPPPATTAADRPKGRVPPPRLPRSYQPNDSADLARICRVVENEAVARAGVSASFANGVTSSLRHTLEGHGKSTIYPVGMYYFIVAEAARGREPKAVAEALAGAPQSAILQRLSELPADAR